MKAESEAQMRDVTMMGVAEAAVYNGLARVFELDQDAGRELAIRVVSQVAGYVADAAALTGGADGAARARDGLILARDELNRLIDGLSGMADDPV